MAPKRQGTPAAIFNNAVDLNRFSNGISRRLLVSYNNIIVRVTEQLAAIGEDESATYKAMRLRAILAQATESLESWPKKSAKLMIKELEGIAGVQVGFIENQLKQALPAGSRDMVRTVEVSPDFARAVVMEDPTDLGVVVLRQELPQTEKGFFNLTARKGEMITLPNGSSVMKTFRGLTHKSADLLTKEIRMGMLTGEPPATIARRLKGQLRFNEKAKSAAQIALAARQSTKVANHQIMTIVRTSVGQIANDAARAVYEANKDIATHYKYVATLDGRTTPICQSLDGRIFRWEDGVYPLQHWGCRSTIVAVIDYEELGIPEPGYKIERAARDEKDGSTYFVSADETYGEWLFKRPVEAQDEILGTGRGRIFRKLAEKYDSSTTRGREAIRKFVSTDGQEIDLEAMQRRYKSISS